MRQIFLLMSGLVEDQLYFELLCLLLFISSLLGMNSAHKGRHFSVRFTVFTEVETCVWFFFFQCIFQILSSINLHC